MPVLHLDNGKVLSQSNAILRYICTTNKGRNGETLYPGHADPMLSWQNDNVIDFISDFTNANLFFYRTKFMSDEYNAKFTEYVTEKLPKWMSTLESMMGKHKFIVSDEISMADIALTALSLIHIYNPEFAHCHILQAVVDQFPKCKAYFEKLLAHFSYWTLTYNQNIKPSKKPLLAYWDIRGLSAALRYQLVYECVDFEMRRFVIG